MIPLHRPTIRRADMDAVLSRLATDQVGAGAAVRELESALGTLLRRRGTRTVRSPFAAYRVAFRALELEPGSRIVLSALAPAWLVALIRASGFHPVAVDVQRAIPILPSPIDLDYQRLEPAAFVLWDGCGYVHDVRHFAEIGVPVIADISRAIGGTDGPTLAGSVETVAIVGLEEGDRIVAGGGATLLTAGGKLAAALGEAAAIEDPGMSDLNAALAVQQLRRLGEFLDRRRELLARFIAASNRGPYRVPLQSEPVDALPAALPVRVRGSIVEAEAYARHHGVATDRAFRLADGWDVGADDAMERFPNALAFAGDSLLFPLYPALSGREVDQIERVLATAP